MIHTISTSTMSTYNPFPLIWANIMSIICDIYQFIADNQLMMRRANKAYNRLVPAPIPNSALATKREHHASSTTTTTINFLNGTPTPERPLGLNLDGSVLRQFLADMQFDTTEPPIPRNEKLKAAAIAYFEAEGMTPEFFEPVKRMVPMLAAAIELPFNDHPFDVKLYITVHSTLLLYIDDCAQRIPAQTVPELSTFLSSLGGNRAEADFKNPNIALFVRLITQEVPRYFGPISTAAIIKSSIDFLVGCLIEAEFPKGLAGVPETSSRFPHYQRLKSGSSEAYAYFLFPDAVFPEKQYLETYLPAVPDITEHIDMINDVLSFYKESVVGTEQNSFLMNSARIHNVDPVELLKDVAAKQKKLSMDISATLSKRPELRKSFETFVKGYIMWHCSEKRYRLSELGIEMGVPVPV